MESEFLLESNRRKVKWQKKSMIVKSQKKQKYKVREYTRCQRCGRPHSVLKKYGICRICFRELAYNGQIPGVKNLVGRMKGGYYGSIMSNRRYAYKNS